MYRTLAINARKNSVPKVSVIISLSSSDLYQHWADVLRSAPGTGGAERRHRSVPDGDENIPPERRHVEPRQLHVLQQAELGVRRN